MTYKSYRQLPGALWLRGLLPVSAAAAPGKLLLLLLLSTSPWWLNHPCADNGLDVAA